MPPLPPRYHFQLRFSAQERSQLEAAAATDLRTPANLVNTFVLAALAKKASRLRVQAPQVKRSKFSIHVHLTRQQRRELERRARAEGRLVANFVSAVVVSKVGRE